MTEHGWPGEHDDVDPHDAADASHHDPGWPEPGWPDPADHGVHEAGYEPLGYHDAPGHHDPVPGGPDEGPADPRWEPLSHLHDTAGPHDSDLGAHDAAGDVGHPGADPVYAMGHVGADPDAVADVASLGELFPPPVDVGALPEPVDGFPWIDPASLGDAVSVAPLHMMRPDPAELAAYAGVDVPDGDPDDTDVWQRLAAVDDPATSALARFWQQPD